jgi:hypothetical protein
MEMFYFRAFRAIGLQVVDSKTDAVLQRRSPHILETLFYGKYVATVKRQRRKSAGVDE